MYICNSSSRYVVVYIYIYICICNSLIISLEMMVRMLSLVNFSHERSHIFFLFKIQLLPLYFCGQRNCSILFGCPPVGNLLRNSSVRSVSVIFLHLVFPTFSISHIQYFPHSVISQSVVYQAVVYQAVVYQAVVYQAVVYQAVVYQSVVFPVSYFSANVAPQSVIPLYVPIVGTGQLGRERSGRI